MVLASMPAVIHPPTPLPRAPKLHTFFLAGSIEQGSAPEWQKELVALLEGSEAIILNPRRLAWDANWEQSIDNPTFREQVEWELEGLRRADTKLFYFAPGTKSPVTLLELGLHAASGNVIVCCPPGFWRKGNVDIVGAQHKIPVVSSLQELAVLAKGRLEQAQ